MDKLIAQGKLQLKGQHKDKCHAYISYQDLRSVPHFRDQTILAIKAPAEAQIHVPDPGEGIRMQMKSEQDEIGVFICPGESDSGASPGKPQAGDMALLPGEQYNDDLGLEHRQQRYSPETDIKKGLSKGGDDLDDILDIIEDMEMETPLSEENHPTGCLSNDAWEANKQLRATGKTGYTPPEGLGQESSHKM